MKKLLGSKNFALLVLAFLVFLFLENFYGEVLFHPNTYLYGISEDAIKNYYTYAYHIKNDSFFIHFGGMNYPYGEHIVYTDCHPFFAGLVKAISLVFPSVQQYSIGIFNFILLISIAVTTVFIFLILTKLKVRNWFAVFGALGITVLAPQIFRIDGHFSLSYSCFIPMTIYFLLGFFESRHKLKWSLILFGSNLLWFFTHPYLGMIAVIILAFCWLIYFIAEFKNTFKSKKKYFYFALQVLLPVLIFKGFMWLTDHHTGRDEIPGGFMEYRANLASVIFPHRAPLRPVIDKIMKVPPQPWESLSYIGLTTIITFLLFSISLLIPTARRSLASIYKSYFANRYFIIILVAGFLMLLFSMGLPFSLNPDVLLNLFPFIKQFRGIGRFAWAFYFIITIASMYFLQILATNLEAKRLKWLGFILMLAAPAMYIYEGWPYHAHVAEGLTKHPNYFNLPSAGAYGKGAEKIEKEKYQAIIPLPFFYIGSENFGITGSEKSYTYAELFSHYTGLPIVGNFLSRSSWNEAKSIVQVLSPAFYPRPIENKIEDKRPFLLLFTKQKLTEYEQELVKNAELFYSNDSISLYELSFNKLFENTAAKEITAFEKLKSSLKPKNDFLVSDTSGIVRYFSYDDRESDKFYREPGAVRAEKKNYTCMIDVEPGKIDSSKEYIVSFWMYNKGSGQTRNLLNCMVFVDAKNAEGKGEWITNYNPVNTTVINGDWSLAELKFKTTNPTTGITVCAKGNDDSKDIIYIDDLLIRPAGTDVYRIERTKDGKITELFKNNHRIIVK